MCVGIAVAEPEDRSAAGQDVYTASLPPAWGRSRELAGFPVPPANPITKEMLAEFMRTPKRTTYRMGPDGKLIQAEA
jgi:hypothetical protein